MQIIHGYIVSEPLFELGQTVMTIGAEEFLSEKGLDPALLLSRHQLGDWSDMLPESQEENKQALENGYRILSSYKIEGEKIWVITEWDRSLTTILLPSEY